jgi:hypothetical protein
MYVSVYVYGYQDGGDFTPFLPVRETRGLF